MSDRSILGICSIWLIALAVHVSPSHAADESFIALFDGKSFDGWVTLDNKPVGDGWEVIDGRFICALRKSAQARSRRRGRLRTLNWNSNGASRQAATAA